MRVEQKVTTDNVIYYVVVASNDEVMDTFSNYNDAYNYFVYLTTIRPVNTVQVSSDGVRVEVLGFDFDDDDYTF